MANEKMEKPDFSKIWGANGNVTYQFSDDNYLKGWGFIGNIPPARGMFDAYFKGTDEKLKWLDDELGDYINSDYTIDDTSIPTKNTDNMPNLLSGMAHMIKSANGTDDWKKEPQTSLDDLAGQIASNNLYHAEATGYGIVSGCKPSIDGLTVTVGAGVIHTYDGRRVEVSEQSITLDAADATKPRTDVVYLDTNGAIAKITGELGMAAVAGNSNTPGTMTVTGTGVVTAGTATTSTAIKTTTPVIDVYSIPIGTVLVQADGTSLSDTRMMLMRYVNFGIVNVRDYGATGDGATDDTAAIQQAIDKNLGKIIFFPSGTYIVSDTIYTYRGDAKRSLLYLLGARIKASADFPKDAGKFVVSIGDKSTGNVSNYWDSHTWCGLIGGIIDGSSRAYGGVKYSDSSIGKLMDFTTVNTTDVGVQVGESTDGVKSTDVYLSRLKLDGVRKEASIGLLLYSYDNNIEYVRTSGFPIGFKIVGGGNYFRECHPLYDGDQYDEEIGFEIAGSDTFVENCYADMFATAIQIESYSHTRINGFFYTRATSRKKNAVFLKNTAEVVNFSVKNFTIGFVSTDTSSKIYDGPRFCYEYHTSTSDYGFYYGNVYGGSISVDDLGAYSELAHQIIYQVTDSVDFDDLLAPGTYWIENIEPANNATYHRPTNLTKYGILKVNSLPQLKGARYLFCEQEVFNLSNTTPTTKYYRSYFGVLSSDGKTLAGTWGVWRKISLTDT